MQAQAGDKNVDVLIVGAGPAGLMMACQLTIRNISFRLIDKKEFPTDYSGALILQARSLEIFQQMGIAQSAVQSGVIAKEIKLIFNGEKTFTIPLGNFGKGLTQFPYLLLLEQSKTVQLLADFINNLSHSIERKTELDRFTQDDSGVTSILKLPDGQETTVTSKYLIAADGARSTIRKQLQIPFVGKTHPNYLFVSDCKAEGNLSSDQLCFLFSDETTTGLFPLNNGKWRIDGVISRNTDTKDLLTFDEVSKSLADKTRVNVKVSEPDWFSVFQVNERCALSFQQNRCFLVGDAAHIHSPVGAQGMNTGLQDSYNLAWKLALVIQGKANTNLLETYSTERVAIAKNVVRGTDLAFTLVTSRHFLVKLFRVHTLPYVLKLMLPSIVKRRAIRHFFFRRISEIGIKYRKSTLSQDSSTGNFPSYATKPGERLPYIQFQENGILLNIQDKVRSTGYHLLLFSKNSEPDAIRRIAEKYTSFLSVETIPYTSNTEDLYRQLGIVNGGYYLVRPDLHIAYRSSKTDCVHFENYLQKFFKDNNII